MASDIVESGFGYRESREIYRLGFVGEVHRDTGTDNSFIARGRCNACGDIVEAEAKPNQFARHGSIHWLPGLVEPFRQHWQEHEARRSEKWEVVYPVILRALKAAYPDAWEGYARALERAVKQRVGNERAICVKAVEDFRLSQEDALRDDYSDLPFRELLSLIADRLRNPTAADYGIAVELTDTVGGNPPGWDEL